MTSFRQFDANRRNARHSTGPVTEGGKKRSRCNAVRHGLTAETVIGTLEDAVDIGRSRRRLLLIMMRNRRWSGSWCCGWPACCGGCVALPTWRLAYSRSRPIIFVHFDRHAGFTSVLDTSTTRCFGRPNRSIRTTVASLTASQTRKTLCRVQHRDLSVRPPTLRIVSCASPICQATRSTGSAVMKPSYGARPARSCSPSTHCNVASHRKDEAGSGADGTVWPPTFEFAGPTLMRWTGSERGD